MHRLSIVIPCLKFDRDAEDTLVSVLQNRPARCEVIVVTAGSYDDPYQLEGEVRFVEAERDASTVQLANCGFAAAQGDIVHLLQPGACVVDGWTDAVLDHFDDPDVGAVSPAVVRSAADDRALWLGVAYWSSGIRRVVGRGVRLSHPRQKDLRVLGPSFFAGFYRRAVVEALDYFDERLVPCSADVDLALSLHRLGQSTVVELASRVVGSADDITPPVSFQTARHSERLYRRHVSAGWGTRLLHVALVCWELLRCFPRPRMLTAFFGRLMGCCESETTTYQRERIARAQDALARLAEETSPAAIYVEFSKRGDSSRKKSGRQQRRRAA